MTPSGVTFYFILLILCGSLDGPGGLLNGAVLRVNGDVRRLLIDGCAVIVEVLQRLPRSQGNAPGGQIGNAPGDLLIGVAQIDDLAQLPQPLSS